MAKCDPLEGVCLVCQDELAFFLILSPAPLVLGKLPLSSCCAFYLSVSIGDSAARCPGAGNPVPLHPHWVILLALSALLGFVLICKGAALIIFGKDPEEVSGAEE